MKKTIFATLLILGLPALIQPVQSQNEFKGKYIFSEIGGPGVILSVNFDSRFKNGERLGLGYRVGAGFGVGEFKAGTADEKYYGYGYGYGYDYAYAYRTRTYYTIPVGLNYVFGKKHSPNTFEIGAGTTLLTRKVALYHYGYAKPGYLIGHLQFMYRRVPVNGGFSFRIGLTPIIGTSGDLFPMAAVGFGYIF
ncbi:MAG: hypothetical protein LBP98_09835 [Tannerella sp.]|jgi:hypothetical protein|nr:hypothetical protein [Tannerella sp.]